MMCHAFAACGGENQLTHLVIRNPPLAGPHGDLLGLDHAIGLHSITAVRVGDVHPVVDIPTHTAWLMLEVAAAAAALENQLFFVRLAVAVRVLVGVEIERVGFANDHLVPGRRQQHARQHQSIDEDGVLVVFAIAVGVLKPHHATRGIALVFAIDVLHVGVHLHHVQAAVGIPLDNHRFIDDRLARDQVQLEPFLKLDALHGFLGRIKIRDGWILNLLTKDNPHAPSQQNR